MACSPGHTGNANDLARFERRESIADEIKVGDAVDLVVIGDAGIAVAKSELGPDVEINLGPT